VDQLARWAVEAQNAVSSLSHDDPILSQLDADALEGTEGLLLTKAREEAMQAAEALELCEATIRSLTDELSLARAEVTRLTEDAVTRTDTANELHARARDAEADAEAARLHMVAIRNHAATLRSLVPERVRPHLPASPQFNPAVASHLDELQLQREQDDVDGLETDGSIRARTGMLEGSGSGSDHDRYDREEVDDD